MRIEIVAGQFCVSEMEGSEDQSSGLNSMVWAVPQYKRSEVNWAGRKLVEGMGIAELPTYEEELNWIKALNIINNWRSSHAYPLNTFQNNLRKKAKDVDPGVVVAQRTKRLWSISHKLERFPTMKLSQVQDIAGCRAILRSSNDVLRLEESYKRSSMRHIAKSTDNYIINPKTSGYRGLHIIWEYSSDKESRAMYNGLKIEMQLRSILQHAWATTVETVGTLTQQALKSSLGEGDWLRFFQLMGTVIALREGMPPVPGTPHDPQSLLAELREYSARVNAFVRLNAIINMPLVIDRLAGESPHYFLMEMTPEGLSVRGFQKGQQQEAQNEYLEVEKRITKDENKDAVLVSADSFASLKRAYPNYFRDTEFFAQILEDVLAGGPLEPEP